MKGIQGDWKFSPKAGFQNKVQLRVLCVFAMDMVILALSFLKVCNYILILLYKTTAYFFLP